MKTVRKLFLIGQYEKEEKWLDDMSAQGWQLVNVNLLNYKFKKGSPNEYAYRLELLDKDAKNKESQAYINFLQDTQVAVVGEVGAWIYLRKKRAEGGFDDDKLSASRLKRSVKIGETFQNIMIMTVVMIAICAIGSMVFHDLKESSVTSFFEGFFDGGGFTAAVISILLIPAIMKNQKKIRAALRDVVIAEKG